MKDASVTLGWFGVPCHCRCRHCLLTSGGRISSVAYKRAECVVERFLLWREEQDEKAMGVSFAVGYSCDFPQLVEHIEFCRRHNMPAADSLQAGGMACRSAEDLRRFLRTLKDVGVREVGLSFYGIGTSHDGFAARRGDFDLLLDIARTAADCGIQRFETIFLRSGLLQELPALLGQLDSIPGRSSRYLTPFDYRGRGKLLEKERPTLSELETLPADVLQFLNRKTRRSEGEWLRSIAAGTVPQRKYRHYLLPIWKENVRDLETTDPGEILSRLRREDARFKQSVPPLAELAGSFGETNGERVYALRDLEWKWQDTYLEKHPEIDVAGRFDDLSQCVLTK